MNIKRADNVTVVKPLTRRLDSTTSLPYHQKLQNLIETGIRNILIDLSEILYLDTRGTAFIIDAMKLIADNGEVALCSPDDRVREFLHSSRLDRVFRIFPNEDIALNSFAA